jgi:copper(I)-binding protein
MSLVAGGTAAAAPDSVSVSEAWARATPAHAHMGAIYLNLLAATGDRLLQASVPHSVSGEAQLHETVVQHDSSGGGDTMKMRQVSSIELPAGQTIRLEPGGFHVMLIDLKHGLKAGDKLSLTLRFERAGTRKVTAEVRGL